MVHAPSFAISKKVMQFIEVGYVEYPRRPEPKLGRKRTEEDHKEVTDVLYMMHLIEMKQSKARGGLGKLKKKSEA